MCDLGDKLVAWLDGELSGCEAEEMERHLAACEECRRCVASYREISGAIVSQCEARFASRVQPQRLRWMPVLSLAAAAGALIVLFPHPGAERRPTATQGNAIAHVNAAEKPGNAAPLGSDVAVRKRAHRHRSVRVAVQAKSQDPGRRVNWVPAES